MPHWDEALASEAERGGLDCIGPFFDERPLESLPGVASAPEAEVLKARVAEHELQNGKSKLRHHFVPMLMFWRVSSLKRLLLEHGGPFDERFFVTYEDTDLLYRAKQLGMKWGETNQCYMWHASRATEHTFLARFKRRWREGRRRKGRF